MALTRRNLLQAGVAAALAPIFNAAEATPGFRRTTRFVFLTDLHIQPELGAQEGVSLAVKKILGLHPRPDFVLTGGDHVMDLLKGDHHRADVQFQCLKEAMRPLEMPIYGVIGNHDVFGWGNKRADQRDAEYGKRMLEERFLHSSAYRSFDIAGWHFALLDGVQPEPKIGWHGSLDDAQLSWLDQDLGSVGDRPKIIVSHFPAMTLFPQYTDGATAAATDTLVLSNGKDLQQLCAKHQVKAVFQGHTHVVEDCSYLGTRYITGGAVCGDWWKGWRLGVHPEGFMIVDLSPTEFKTTYVSYGWNAKEHPI